jgi:hypothetical protein
LRSSQGPGGHERAYSIERALLQEEFRRRTALRVIQEHYTGMLGIRPGDYKPYVYRKPSNFTSYRV